MKVEGFNPWGAFDTAITNTMAYDYFTARRYARYVVAELGLDGHAEGSLIDVGCQFGALGEALVKSPLKYVGVDVDDDVLQVARGRLPSAEFFQCDIEDCQVKSLGVHDVVVCSLVLGLLEDVGAACQNLLTLAGEAGRVIVLDLLRDSVVPAFGDYSTSVYVKEQVERSISWSDVGELVENMRRFGGGRQVRRRRLVDDGASLLPAGRCSDISGGRCLDVFELRVG